VTDTPQPYDFPDTDLKLLDMGRSMAPAGKEIDNPWAGGRIQGAYEIWYVRQGKAQIREERGEWKTTTAGCLVLFKRSRFYEVRQDPEDPLGVTYARFHLQPAQDQASLDQLPLRITGADPTFCEALSRRILELYWEAYIDGQRDPSLSDHRVPMAKFEDEPETVRKDLFAPKIAHLYSPEEIEGRSNLILARQLLRSLLMEFCHLAERGRIEVETGVKKYQHRLIGNLAARLQADLENVPSVTEMAHSCGYSLDHFGRVFRSVMGQSPQHFIMTQRTNQARRLLRESDLSIKEIAADLGYRSPYFFSRQFKSMTGQTPSDYRAG